MRKLATTTFFSFLAFDITQLAATFCNNFQKRAEKWASEYSVNTNCSVVRRAEPCEYLPVQIAGCILPRVARTQRTRPRWLCPVLNAAVNRELLPAHRRPRRARWGGINCRAVTACTSAHFSLQHICKYCSVVEVFFACRSVSIFWA